MISFRIVYVVSIVFLVSTGKHEGESWITGKTLRFVSKSNRGTGFDRVLGGNKTLEMLSL